MMKKKVKSDILEMHHHVNFNKNYENYKIFQLNFIYSIPVSTPREEMKILKYVKKYVKKFCSLLQKKKEKRDDYYMFCTFMLYE